MVADRSDPGGNVEINTPGSVAVGRDIAGRDIVYNIQTQGVDPAVLRELEDRLNQFLAQFLTLHRQLEEWKDLHNVLQDLQVRFTTCRSYGLELSRRDDKTGKGLLGALSGASTQQARQLERWLYEFSLNWQQCKITVDQLRRFTMGLRHTGPAYDPRAQTGPESMKLLDRAQVELEATLADADRYNLADHIGEYAKLVDDYLYLADKALRDVAKQINELPQQVRLTEKL
jgi:hypothetical protein